MKRKNYNEILKFELAEAYRLSAFAFSYENEEAAEVAAKEAAAKKIEREDYIDKTYEDLFVTPFKKWESSGYKPDELTQKIALHAAVSGFLALNYKKNLDLNNVQKALVDEVLTELGVSSYEEILRNLMEVILPTEFFEELVI